MSSKKNIIIIKKVAGHGGHHGGAWKVAYADFVTAMMALFIVLWLLNCTPHVKKAVAGYFQDPLGKSKDNGSEKAGEDSNSTETTSDAAKEKIEKLKEQMQKSIESTPDLNPLAKQIQMKITPDGLRIELLESSNGTFFDSGSPVPNDKGKEVLSMLARQLTGVPNRVSIEGHTDSQGYGSSSYTNWELSADRANAARRILQSSGLRENQVSEVRGYADQRLRVESNPMDPSNRRIAVVVQYADGAKLPAISVANLPQGVQVSTPADEPSKPSASTPATPAPATPAQAKK
ncbi:flagellar motor protein MotB [Silvibacterium sp.]|uniref:flagellar motor protein MotB n=1 Tax=Silvibacterium sp. TaxID=1964179 RepID=UPI0039E70706